MERKDVSPDVVREEREPRETEMASMEPERKHTSSAKAFGFNGRKRVFPGARHNRHTGGGAN